MVIVGGTGVVSTAVETALKAHAGFVQRVSGANRLHHGGPGGKAAARHPPRQATTTSPVLSFVRFSGGAVTLDSRAASETSPVTIVEVNGTSVLWIGQDRRQARR